MIIKSIYRVCSTLIILSLISCENKHIEGESIPIQLQEIKTIEINPDLKVDSTHIEVLSIPIQDSLWRADPLKTCICSKKQDTISISIARFMGFENTYLSMQYYSGGFNAHFEFSSDLPDPEAYLFKQKLILNKADFKEYDLLKGKVAFEALLTGDMLNKDSSAFMIKESFTCSVRDSTYNWTVASQEAEAEYRNRKLLDFLKLAESDSAINTKKLNLRSLGLKSIPKEVMNFKNLEELHLYANDISYFDISILGELSRLKTLNLNNNNIKVLSRGLNELKSLEVLELSSNPIEEIPNELYDLTNLRKIDLRLTKIEKLSSEVGNLKNLEVLDLGSNDQLTYIPDEVFQLPKLNELRLPDSYIVLTTTSWLLDSLKSLSINYMALESRVDIVKRLGNLDFLTVTHAFDRNDTVNKHSVTYRRGQWLDSIIPQVRISSSITIKKY